MLCAGCALKAKDWDKAKKRKVVFEDSRIIESN
jgi:hypothetical protein